VKTRTSSHVFALGATVVFTAIAHYSIYYGALIRGYETSAMSAYRNIALVTVLAFLPILLKKFLHYHGTWTLYTSCILLFAIGLVVQYRLFSDNEYIAAVSADDVARIENSNASERDKSRELRNLTMRAIAREREEKIETVQMRYIKENYSPEKKQMMGLPPTPPAPVNLSKETFRSSNVGLSSVLTSTNTWIPVFAIIFLVAAFVAVRRDDVLALLRGQGFIIVLLTLVPLIVAAITSRGGKSIGNMTPWEPAKVPFLIGFAAVVSLLYRDLARTHWGLPRAKDVLPLVVIGAVPFVPFLMLRDFGQMMVFGSVYVTLYVIAVRRFSQRFLLVGSVILIMAVLVVGALPSQTQEKIPLLPTLATPVKAVLPDRVQQRFHLWIDGFNPPSPETSWWKEDYDDYLAELVKRDPSLPAMIEQDPSLVRTINVDAWFDNLAFQPAQATFGIASGGVTGRGLGLGHPEVIPVADSDYIYAALGEELGLVGGLLVMLALIVFVSAGVQTARDSRDMFSKLCVIGLAAFIGFQALVNIGGITRALPMTGITLPFVSHGGFSLLTSFVMLGMLLAFSHRNAVDRMKDEAEITPEGKVSFT
jgi:cell division protein FtsW (lipid II flippase)